MTGGGWHGRVAAFASTLLLLLLPAVLAARHLGEPPGAAEIARVQRALAAPAASRSESEVARWFLGSTLPASATWPATADAQQALLARARLAAVGAVLGLSLVTYLIVLLARGRLQALLACVGLATLPAVAQEGHVLRPEAPAALFAAFAVLLLQCLAQARRARGAAGLVLCAASSSGLAVATFPADGAPLLVAGIVLTLGALHFGLRSVRAARRRGWSRLPVRALNARLLPWTGAALLTPAMTLWLLGLATDGAVDGLAPSAGASFWPAHPAWRIAFAALLALGAITALVRTGQRWRQRGRIGADLVLFVFAVAALAGGLPRPEGQDRLALAVPAAVLFAEAVWALAMLVQWRRLTSPLPVR